MKAFLQKPCQLAGEGIKVIFFVSNARFGGIAENKTQIPVTGKSFDFIPLFRTGKDLFQHGDFFHSFHCFIAFGNAPHQKIVLAILVGKLGGDCSGTGFDGIDFAIEVGTFIHLLNQWFNKAPQKNAFTKLQDLILSHKTATPDA